MAIQKSGYVHPLKKSAKGPGSRVYSATFGEACGWQAAVTEAPIGLMI